MVAVYRRAAESWWAFPVALFVVTRVAILAYAHIGMALIPELYVRGGVRDGVLNDYPGLDGLCRWDCGIYADLARDGWLRSADTVFWPLLPLLARGLTWISGLHVHFALIFWAQVGLLVTLLFMYRLFVELADEVSARLGLTAFMAFPFAYFLSGAWAESLLTGLTAAAAYYAHRSRHFLAGVLAALGVLARHISLLVWVTLLACQIAQRGKAFWRSPSVLSLALPGLSVLGWMWFCHRVTGDPLSFSHARDEWGAAAWMSWRYAFAPGAGPHLKYYVYFAVIPVAGTVALFLQRRWIPLGLFSAAMTWTVFAIGAYALGRYAGSLWPAYLPIGVALSRMPKIQAPLLTCFGLLQGLFFWLTLHQWPVF